MEILFECKSCGHEFSIDSERIDAQERIICDECSSSVGYENFETFSEIVSQLSTSVDDLRKNFNVNFHFDSASDHDDDYMDDENDLDGEASDWSDELDSDEEF